MRSRTPLARRVHSTTICRDERNREAMCGTSQPLSPTCGTLKKSVRIKLPRVSACPLPLTCSGLQRQNIYREKVSEALRPLERVFAKERCFSAPRRCFYKSVPPATGLLHHSLTSCIRWQDPSLKYPTSSATSFPSVWLPRGLQSAPL